jgi:hypothetical protein
MDSKQPDLAKAVYELDKRTSVFQARCEQRFTSDEQFQSEVREDMRELKQLVTDLRIKRAADSALVSLVVSGALLIAAELLRKLIG